MKLFNQAQSLVQEDNDHGELQKLIAQGLDVNPVDITLLKVERSEDFEKITIELFFDFESGGSAIKNQGLRLNDRINKKTEPMNCHNSIDQKTDI